MHIKCSLGSWFFKSCDIIFCLYVEFVGLGTGKKKHLKTVTCQGTVIELKNDERM